MSYRLVCVLAILVSGNLACSKDPEVAKREFVQSGDGFVAAGKLKEAAIEYRNAIQQDPRYGEARFKLAEVAWKLGDVPTARDQYVRAADLLPADATAQVKAGQVLLLSGKFDDARARADKALEQDSGNAEALILRGNALAGLKDYEAAVKQVEEAIRVDPNRGLTFANLGALQLARGAREDAEVAFKRAVALDPQSIEAHVALANYYWITNTPALAERELKAALELAPNDIVVNRALAFLYVALNRASEAETPLKLIVDQTKDPKARLVLVEYYQGTGRADDAIAILDELAADPTLYANARARKAAILYSTGKKSEAFATLEEVLARQPKSEDALLAKAQLLTADGNLDGALQAASAAASDGRSAGGDFAVGRIQTRRGEYEAAIAAYLEALRLSPTFVPARLELARLYIASNRFEEGLHAAEDVLTNQRDNVAAVLLKARALLGLGNQVGAEQALRGLPASLVSSPVVQAQLGTLYMLKHDGASARAAYQAALKADRHNYEAIAGLTALDFGQKHAAAAVARLDAAVAESPKSAPLLLLASQSHLAAGNRPRAEQLLRRALDLNPANIQAYAQLGRMYALEGRLGEAQAEFEQIATRKPDSVSAHTMVGVLLEMQNRRDDARARYEQALRLDQRAAVAANNLAMIHVDQGGNLDVALQLAQTAKAQLPDMPEVNDTLGWIYYKKGLPDLALPPLLESVQKDPANAGYQAHLGLAYAVKGDTKKAQEHLSKAFAHGDAFPDAAEARKAMTTLAKVAG